jgi:uncharacterized lipoprotein
MFSANITRTLSCFLLVSLFTGCTTIVRQMDSTWNDRRTVYDKSASMPPLEVPADLASTEKDNKDHTAAKQAPTEVSSRK